MEGGEAGDSAQPSGLQVHSTVQYHLTVAMPVLQQVAPTWRLASLIGQNTSLNQRRAFTASSASVHHASWYSGHCFSKTTHVSVSTSLKANRGP